MNNSLNAYRTYAHEPVGDLTERRSRWLDRAECRPPTPREVFGEIGAVVLGTTLFVAVTEFALWLAGI